MYIFFPYSSFQLTRSISQSGYNGDLSTSNYGPMSANSALSAHSPGSPYHNTRASQGSLNLMHTSSRPSLNKVSLKTILLTITFSMML